MTRNRRNSGTRPFVVVSLVAVAVGFATATSVAFAATLSVGSEGITTSSIPTSVPATTCTVAPSADAALDRASQGSNYGNLAFLTVRAQNGNNHRRSVVRFDLTSCAIPSGAVVRSADLTLTVMSPPGSSRTYAVHRVTGSWDESTVTFANQPTFAAGATSTIATGTAPASLSWSVLSDVDAFVKGTVANNGWLMQDADEKANPAVETIFGSRENATPANRPSLTIAYYP